MKSSVLINSPFTGMFISNIINDVKLPDGSNITDTHFGFMAACPQLATALFSPVHVFLANKYGTKPVSLAYMALLFPLKFYIYAGELPDFYTFVVIDTIASVFFWGLFVIGPIEVNKWFPVEKRPFPNAVILSGMGFGSLVFTLVYGFTAENFGATWTECFLWTFVSGAVILVPLVFFIRDPKENESFIEKLEKTDGSGNVGFVYLWCFGYKMNMYIWHGLELLI